MIKRFISFTALLLACSTICLGQKGDIGLLLSSGIGFTIPVKAQLTLPGPAMNIELSGSYHIARQLAMIAGAGYSTSVYSIEVPYEEGTQFWLRYYEVPVQISFTAGKNKKPAISINAGAIFSRMDTKNSEHGKFLFRERNIRPCLGFYLCHHFPGQFQPFLGFELSSSLSNEDINAVRGIKANISLTKFLFKMGVRFDYLTRQENNKV